MTLYAAIGMLVVLAFTFYGLYTYVTKGDDDNED
jgi:hypothetical protein